ncbi:hypothetical protein [Exiguobacterium sp. CinTr1]|uniref:hypothetical protein n=1 Tax=Exiguobacterium sp. CinTr1 TaxID=2995315 RepID=UPI0022E681ED|nr:hypothetical protein [Exiguobacterium sp. CinTr1]
MKLKTTIYGKSSTLIGTPDEVAEFLTKVRHKTPQRLADFTNAIKAQKIVFHEPFKPTFEPIAQTREEIINEAIADVAELLKGEFFGLGIGATELGRKVRKHVGHSVCFGSNDEIANFFVNKRKRVVVAKIYSNHVTNTQGDGTYIATGIARCAPSDVFNEHVGKAIALRRALGLPVPDKYCEVGGIAPEGKQVGDVAIYPSLLNGESKVNVVEGHVRAVRGGEIGVLTSLTAHAKVIDDSARYVAPSTPAAKVVYVD